MRPERLAPLAGAVAMLLAFGPLRLSPLSGQRSGSDSSRVKRLVASARASGFGRALVVAHGSGPLDPLFILAATSRADSGVLLLAAETGGGAAHFVILERARTPADLGVRAVQLAPFLGSRDLIDVDVNHQPFMLEVSRTYRTHHIVRRQGDAVSAVCDLEGGSTASYSKGIGSSMATREVTMARVPGSAMVFSVRTVSRTVERRDTGSVPVTDSTTTLKWVEIPAVGPCREVRAPGP